MKRFTFCLNTLVLVSVIVVPAKALLIGGPDIIAAPVSVTNDPDGATNDHQQGFDERQNVTLLADLAVDGGLIIPAGTVVNSHMIFLNTEGPRKVRDAVKTWTFNGMILGVMSDNGGKLEAASSAFLGAPDTTYPAAFPNRGMERFPQDYYVDAGNSIAVRMEVAEAGDWIRVITLATNRPPDCSNAAPSVATLWPPNDKFVPITVTGVTDPDGDPITITIDSIFQDEPVKAEGSGNTSPDGKGVGTDTAKVRAECSGTKEVPGNGRVYHIRFTADDGNEGTCSGTVTVCVPHDTADSECVDDGPKYDSTLEP